MNIYDFSVDKINGEFTSLREYEGKVILIVNSATRCGFTPQYGGRPPEVVFIQTLRPRQAFCNVRLTHLLSAVRWSFSN